MKADLEGRINTVLENALPKDVQAAVCSRNITLADVAATDKTPAGYKATVTVQKAAAKFIMRPQTCWKQRLVH